MSVARRIVNRRVYVWGDGRVGCLGGRSVMDRPVSKAVSFNIPNPVEVTAGWSHSSIRSEDGLLYALGRTHDIQNTLRIARMWRVTAAGVRVWKSIECPEPRYVVPPETHLPTHDPIVSGATSACLTAITTASGKAFLYGDNRHGQCGNGEPSDRIWDPTELLGVRDVDRIEQVALGFQHGLARTASGSVYAWGKGDRGQLGIGGAQSSAVATPVPAFDQERDPPEVLTLPPDVQQRIDAEQSHRETHMLGDTTEYIDVEPLPTATDGGGEALHHSSGHREDSLTTSRPERRNPTDFRLEHVSHRATSIGCGLNHSMAVTNEGKLFVWGKYCSPIVNEAASGHEDQFVPRQAQLSSPVTAAACGQYHTTMLTNNGSLWSMGMQTAVLARQRHEEDPDSYRYDTLSRFVTEPDEVAWDSRCLEEGEDIVKVVAGWGKSAVITSRGYVYTYQWDEPPTRMSELDQYFVEDIAFGWRHTIMIASPRNGVS